MRYDAYKVAAIVLLLLYFAVGIYAKTASREQEIYPVFSWALFWFIPNTVTSYTIGIDRLGNVSYAPPLFFSHAGDLAERVDSSPTEFTRRFISLGDALNRHDATSTIIFEKQISTLFSGKPYAYTLYKVTYDPYKYWKTGEYASATPITQVASTP